VKFFPLPTTGIKRSAAAVLLLLSTQWAAPAYASDHDIFKAVKTGVHSQSEHADQSRVRVNYIANDGFLISSRTKTILVDALFKNPFGYPDPPEEIIEKMVHSQPPFARIDLMLFSHAHRDHFEPETALRVLMRHPETIFVANRAVCTELKEAAGEDYAEISERIRDINPEWGEIRRESIAGINMGLFCVNHAAPEKPYETLAFVLDLNGMKVLHLGDLNPPANAEHFKNLQLHKENISLAFIDPFCLLDESGRASVREYIRPREIVLMHLRPQETDKYAADVKRHFTNIHVFRESMESKLFPIQGKQEENRI